MKLIPMVQKNLSLEFVMKEGNILGMMPHPERAAEALLGSEDGKRIFQSISR